LARAGLARAGLALAACAVAAGALAGCGSTPSGGGPPGSSATADSRAAGVPGPQGAGVVPPELVFVHGVVRTLRPGEGPRQALAVSGNRIALVGSDRDVLALAGASTRVIDLRGRPLYPGFSDGHMHLSGYGRALQAVDLVGTASLDEVVARVKERAAREPPGTWILGRGWDQNDWARKEFPTHEALSRAVPGHPVVLTRIDGHALLCNAAALAAAGLDGETTAPDGGRVLRAPDGSPTGVLVDNAMELVQRVVPAETTAQLLDGVRLAIAELHRRGITSVHDAGVPLSTVQAYAELARGDAFTLRAHVMLSGDEPCLHWNVGGLPTRDLTGQGLIAVRAIKMYADGALGSRGAALLEDYADDPGNRGLLLTPPEQIESMAELALRKGWQLCVHAIGDRGNRLVLDAMEQALAAVPPGARPPDAQDPRFRIEHCQVLAPPDITRFARLGVIPSMQCQHQTSDMPWAEARLGPERVRGAYAWRSLLDTGVIVCGGSDCPVEQPDPIAAFHAAVTRCDERGQPPGGWQAEQAMTREEALAMLTAWPAFAAFDEARLGTLQEGKLADLVVLSEDLLTAPAERLPQVAVDLTVFDGRLVYERAP